MDSIPLHLMISSECLLEEKTSYPGEVFAQWGKAQCKGECYQLAVGKGAPYWSFNWKTKRCHFKVTNSDPKPAINFWSGNTDSSCYYECGSGSKFQKNGNTRLLPNLYILRFWPETKRDVLLAPNVLLEYL